MKKLYQYRYYGNSSQNFPPDLDATLMSSGELLRNKGVITHLGLQASPETAFYLNHSDNPIFVGKTGIFEIDVEGYGVITSIAFTEDTLNHVHEGDGILIDIIYEGGTFA